MQEITLAAERLRQYNAGEPNEPGKYTAISFDEALTLANAYLAEHHADDGELISDSWMDATFGRRHGGNTFWKIAANMILFRHADGFTLNRHDPHASISNITTRGQLRRLIEVLR